MINRKTFGVVSYNINCNFTNYGSALQSWALTQAIEKIGKGEFNAKLVDYCPRKLEHLDPLNPFSNMWDKDEESRRMCELTMPAIKENYLKFDNFYSNRFKRTVKKYTDDSFNDIVKDENIDGFVCGSDTIFCPDEFGFVDGYYANCDCMKNGYSVAYAASFGDPHFTEDSYKILNNRLKNFKAIGLRENLMIPYVKEHTDVLVQKVLDPTLLLEEKDYNCITADKQLEGKYLLLYSRRYNPRMEEYAINLAKKNGWQIVEISLRATNSDKGHIMRYDAGVEEFLSLIKHAEYVVTNSFHGMIFSVQFRKDFVIFSREQCDTKIIELLELFGLSDRIRQLGTENSKEINYDVVHQNIEKARTKSISFLKMELDNCL